MFMGSTYILELDASKDFARMANVLPEDEATSRNLKKGCSVSLKMKRARGLFAGSDGASFAGCGG
jgi:hypothetical protein